MGDGSLASMLGLPRSAEVLYRQVLPGSGQSIVAVAASLALTPTQLLAHLHPLIERGIAQIEDGLLIVASPVRYTADAVAAQSELLTRVGRELSRIAAALPMVVDSGGDRLGDTGVVYDASDSVPHLLIDWIAESGGNLSFLRPDQWRLPSESEMAVVVTNAIRDGRRVRAVYPARALAEAPHVLATRARIGEEIRVVSHVLTRMAIVGTGRALLPTPLGVGSQHRIAVRQPALVEMLQAYFDLVWESASPVASLHGELGRPGERKLLLMQLAEGAKDEQIARNLGLSLRTVRRRVAALMDDLGVDSRFQAGVEAVRHGWL